MVDSGRNFTTAITENTTTRDEATAFHYQIDGKPLVIYPPDASQMTLLIAATMNSDEDEVDPQTVATIIQAFMGMLDEKSARLVRRRLLDPNDPFDLETVVDIVAQLAEDVVARPTESSSASSPSRPATGNSSTASVRPKASTRSRSVRAVSST
jgi:hypothetical protein